MIPILFNSRLFIKKSDVIGWINQLYEDVYIHISVLNELLLNRSVAENKFMNKGGNFLIRMMYNVFLTMNLKYIVTMNDILERALRGFMKKREILE